MPSLLFVNPLKPGKLNDYKAFVAELIGPRKAEYLDLLKRYGAKSSKVYYHRMADKEFVVVIDEFEPEKEALLADWDNSEHPFDLWFKAQLASLHDFEYAGTTEMLLDYES